jgi:hypothetical protein
VRARLGESRIHLNCRLQSFTQDDGGVTAYFFDRHGSHRHSARRCADRRRRHPLAGREKLFPTRAAALERLMLWRGAIDWPAFSPGARWSWPAASPPSS